MTKELYELKQAEERLILVGVEQEGGRSAMEMEACLDELEELVKTAGGYDTAAGAGSSRALPWQRKAGRIKGDACGV